MSKLILICLFIFASWVDVSLGQAIFETGNKIDTKVSAKISFNDSKKVFTYDYMLESLPTSKQDVWIFEVIHSKAEMVVTAQSPDGWYKPSWSGLYNLPPIPPFGINWGAPQTKQIPPGGSAKGFRYTSDGLPTITDYYAEGYHPLPSFPEGSAPDGPIPGYHDLTPYGPGVVGKTIGPTVPPADFKPLDFLNSIINMKHEAYRLGWIKNEGIVKSLDAKLENAKKDIEKGNTRSAKNTLKAFINEVEAQGCESYENCLAGKDLTPEAYGLLKYNAQYLIDHL